MSHDVTLGPLVFPTWADRPGWYWHDLTDWYGLTDDKVDVQERVAAHGAFPERRSWRQSRAITLGVTYMASDRADLIRAIDAVSAVGAEGPVTMTVEDELATTSRLVTVRHVDVPPDRAMLDIEIQVDLLARDPRRYSTVVQEIVLTGGASSGALTYPITYPIHYRGAGTDSPSGQVTNAGTGTAYPVITVQGEIPGGFRLIDSAGRSIVYEMDVLAASPVTVDCGRRVVTVGGVNHTWALSRREWFEVPPHGSLTISYVPAQLAGPSYATVALRDTWM